MKIDFFVFFQYKEIFLNFVFKLETELVNYSQRYNNYEMN